MGDLISGFMIEPSFEDPIDSAEDLVNNNITLFANSEFRVFESLKDHLLSLNISEWTIAAENMINATDCASYPQRDEDQCSEIIGLFQYYIKYHLLGNGTHAFLTHYLRKSDIYPDDLFGFSKKWKQKWWRSKETLPGASPYGGYYTNRKWVLNEVC